MAVDKDLFLYDLAVVAIMKNEAPYVKEWLDYHLAAGVDHFYIYDNESPDNLKEVLQPFIDAGIVTYIFYPGICKQIRAYNETFKAYKFFCRYMAFIDADEFIFPQNNKSIVEVVDEVFNSKENLGGAEINWMIYGSNNLEKADYRKGVLERFTRRANEITTGVKTIANPRKIHHIESPHYLGYFIGVPRIIANTPENPKGVSEKILINHYWTKSREEFFNKMQRGPGLYNKLDISESDFNHGKNNDVFDDSILKYRAKRHKKLAKDIPKVDYEKLINALFLNLYPILSDKAPEGFFEGKMETFLTCLELATHLKENILDEARGEIIEKASLKAVYKTTFTKLTPADSELLISELPNILKLNYPEVKDIFDISLIVIEKFQDELNKQINSFGKLPLWKHFDEYDNLLRILKTLEPEIKQR